MANHVPVLVLKPHYFIHAMAAASPTAKKIFLILRISQDRILKSPGDTIDGYSSRVPFSASKNIDAMGWDNKNITRFLDGLTSFGFACWYRNPGRDGWVQSPQNFGPHLQCIYPDVKLNSLLRGQVVDFLNYPILNGLSGHAPYLYWQPKNTTITSNLYRIWHGNSLHVTY